jgi:hypothetical protein
MQAMPTRAMSRPKEGGTGEDAPGVAELVIPCSFVLWEVMAMPLRRKIPSLPPDVGRWRWPELWWNHENFNPISE